jgi:hypothetical protein
MSWLSDTIKENVGTVVGGIVGYYSGGTTGGSTSIAMGSAAGNYIQHGDVKRALQAGAMGYAAGSGIANYETSSNAEPITTNSNATPVVTNPNYAVSTQVAPIQGAGHYGPAGRYGPSSSTSAMKTLADTKKAGEESYWDKGIAFAKDNPSAVLTGGTLLYGAMQGAPDDPEMNKNEYDEYRKCLASGRGDCVAPSSLYSTGRDHLPLGRSNMGGSQIDQSLIRPQPTQIQPGSQARVQSQPQGIASLPPMQSRGDRTGLMNELNPRRM